MENVLMIQEYALNFDKYSPNNIILEMKILC